MTAYNLNANGAHDKGALSCPLGARDARLSPHSRDLCALARLPERSASPSPLLTAPRSAAVLPASA